MSCANAIVRRVLAVSVLLIVSGCASLGDTAQEKRAAILKMRDETMARLYKEQPQTKRMVASAAGYGVFDAASQNVILLQTSGGYGVLTASDGKVTYMKVGGAGVGFGMGLKNYRQVLIFRSPRAFAHFRDVGWDATANAEATAKAGAQGAAAATERSVDVDVVAYELTDSGVALQATIGARKYWKWVQLNP